jgi:putative membrane protein
MLKQLVQFISRWTVNSLGLALCAYITIIDVTGGVVSFVIAGLLLALLNALIKPLLIIFSLPLIALTLGFFLIIINGVVMYLLSVLYEPLNIQNFWYAMVAGIIIGLVNYIVTILYERLVSNE